ncbi:FAD-dependent oxidoreductase [Candidatus Poribacteria bacterium]|nr:FAD-dependent oxidoreductase [Candidatus Poribacteria bacterium]
MKHLLSEGRIGSLTTRNRIVMAAMHLGYAEDGYVTERFVRYYEECAKGEAGLLFLGGFKMHRLGGGGIGFLSIEDDKYIPSMKKMNARLHSHGAKTAAQLFHGGRYAFSFMMDGEQPVSASAIPSKLTRETPRALSIPEIHETIEHFAAAARRAREADFDAVEVMGSTGYLIAQFLSPVSNTRDDEYGGSLENRARFGIEVIRTVKRACGNDYPVVVRHSGAELMDGGNTIEESVKIAKLFEEAGADAISIQVGWHESRVPTVAASVPRGAFVFLARFMRPHLSVPVVTCNRINDPLLAEQILADGSADFIAMARALNADPYFAKKVREGRFDEIIPCTGCNEGCLDTIFGGQPSTCMNNPTRGRENELALVKSANPRKIMLVGGGPGGLEAARVLAQRGHRVTLFEKSKRLGGRLALSAIPPGREEFGNTVRYLDSAARRAGVEIICGIEMTPEKARKEKPDVLVLATGGITRIPNVPGIDNDKVILADEALTGGKPLGRKVVVIGAGGVACEVAIFVAREGRITPETALFLIENNVLPAERTLDLAHKGPHQVTLVRRGSKVGDSLGRSTRWLTLQELKNLGVRTITDARYVRVTDEGLLISLDGQQQMLEADTIIIAAGYEADPRLKERWAGAAPEIHILGDAHIPQKGIDAIYEATILGRKI